MASGAGVKVQPKGAGAPVDLMKRKPKKGKKAAPGAAPMAKQVMSKMMGGMQ